MNEQVLSLEPWIAAEVHQAEGALMARLDVSITEAAATLRRISHLTGAPLIDVAREVLAGSESGRARR